MPKLHFTDVGVASALLGIRDAQQAATHPLRGALFETLVAADLMKTRRNRGLHEPLSFWRDHVGSEVDVVIERGSEVAAVQIKSGVSAAPDALGGLHRWQRHAVERRRFSAIHAMRVYGSSERCSRDGVDIMPWSTLQL